MLRVLPLAGVICAAVLGSSTSAHACKCATPPPVRDALDAATAVFEGQVGKLTPLGADLIVELNVVRTWKGADSEHVLLRTRKESAACGFAFEPEQSYLIYAGSGPSEPNLPNLQVFACGRSKPMSAAEPDLVELGVGVVPVSARGNDLPPGTEPATDAKDSQSPSPPRVRPAAGGCGGCSASAATRGESTWLAAAFVLMLIHRRRSS